MFFKKKEEEKKDPVFEEEDPIKYFEEKYGWDSIPMGKGTSITLKPESNEDNFNVLLNPSSGFTPFPKTNAKLILLYESEKKFVEETYYWILHFMRHGAAGLPNVEKLLDSFSSSVQSSLFGVSEQRLAIQQDRASQYLKGISEMVKSLPQLIRDLRLLDERLSFYEATFNNPDTESADHALKGIWIDLVEGGAKNPGSVYGMAQQLNFTILPDLFFRTRVGSFEKDMNKLSLQEYNDKVKQVSVVIDKIVDDLDFNEKVKEVLKRKLIQFYTWKYRTYRELLSRRKFLLKYLRQHYNTIKMYAEWVKPYLMNIKRLSNNQKNLNSPDIVNAFETAVLELELFSIARKKEYYNGVVSVYLRYVTMPALQYHAEGYQRGPQHSGRIELYFRSYSFTDNEVKLYKKLRSEQSLELLKEYDSGIAEVLESLGDELKEYLKEAGEDVKTQKEIDKENLEKKKIERLQSDDKPFEMFSSLLEGFKELFNFGVSDFLENNKNSKNIYVVDDKVKEEVFEKARKGIYAIYKYYKKSHGFMAY